jgi:hypothetical protein
VKLGVYLKSTLSLVATLPTIATIGLALSLTACGGGGGGGGGAAATGDTATTLLYKEDIAKLANSEVKGFAKANALINNSFTKSFGGSTSADVKAFIDARVKHVYSKSEVEAFSADIIFSGGHKETRILKDLFQGGDEPEVNPNSGSQLAGVNYGGGLAIMQSMNRVKIVVNLPSGPVESNTSRIGLIGLTNGYSTLNVNDKTIPMPLEGRISVLVHEGRHSDCPDSFDADNCGYQHRICPAGHPLAGERACDNSVWGPYAIQGVYLSSTQDNYAANSFENRIIESMVNDNFSRVNPTDLELMKTTSPDLNSL